LALKLTFSYLKKFLKIIAGLGNDLNFEGDGQEGTENCFGSD
jgi:hypothetical protein